MAKRFKNLQEALKSPDAATSVAVDLEQDQPAQNSERLSRLVTFPNLKELIISAAVCEVPESLGQLRSVESLRIELCDCGDDPLPSTLGMLTALKSLEIERSEIAKVPSTIGELVNLRSLSLRQTSIRELPSSISGCKDLEELDCSECHDLAAIPRQIGGLGKLKSLSLDGRFTEIPIELAALANLEELFLDGKFIEIPAALAELPALKKVYCRGRFSKIELSYFDASPPFERENFRSEIATFNSASAACMKDYAASIDWPIFLNPIEALKRPLKGIPIYPSFKQAALPGEEILIKPASPRHENAFRAVTDGAPVVFVSEYDGNRALLGHLEIGTLITSGENDYGTYKFRCGDRVELISMQAKDTILLADIDDYLDIAADSDSIDISTVKQIARVQFETHLKAMRTPKGKLTKALEAFESGFNRAARCGSLSYFIAARLPTGYETRQQLLLLRDESERLKLLGLL
jgi:hypothetical protein